MFFEPLIKRFDPDDIWAPAAEDYARHSPAFPVERGLHEPVILAPSLTQFLAKIAGFLI